MFENIKGGNLKRKSNKRDNTLAKSKKGQKGQTLINKALHRELKIVQHEPTKTRM